MIKRALADDPTNGAYLDSLGWAYYKQEKLAEAEDSLRQAALREPGDATILDHLGDVYFKRGKLDLAAAQWDHALMHGITRCRWTWNPINFRARNENRKREAPNCRAKNQRPG